MSTYYLVCLHEPCSQEAADFIANCLTRPLAEGGANLIVTQEKLNEGHGGLILHVSASEDRLNSIATDMDLKKFDESDEKVLRNFKASEYDMFPPLTLAEKHKCILYAMEMVHFDKDEKELPGKLLTDININYLD